MYYLIFYLNRVVKTSAAPYVFLIGQVADGLCTPTIAILSDKFSTRIGYLYFIQEKEYLGTLRDLYWYQLGIHLSIWT